MNRNEGVIEELLGLTCWLNRQFRGAAKHFQEAHRLLLAEAPERAAVNAARAQLMYGPQAGDRSVAEFVIQVARVQGAFPPLDGVEPTFVRSANDLRLPITTPAAEWAAAFWGGAELLSKRHGPAPALSYYTVRAFALALEESSPIFPNRNFRTFGKLPGLVTAWPDIIRPEGHACQPILPARWDRPVYARPANLNFNPGGYHVSHTRGRFGAFYLGDRSA